MKPILVLGSAPTATLPENIDAYYVIAVNGSIAAFPNLVPDELIINAFTFYENKRIGPESRAKLKGRKTKKLIAIMTVINRDFILARSIVDSRINYEEVEFWTKQKRIDICQNVSGIECTGRGGDHVPSTGVSALCYALTLSSDVTISGIDTSTIGHSYSKDDHQRSHLEMDNAILRALSGRYKILGESND